MKLLPLLFASSCILLNHPTTTQADIFYHVKDFLSNVVLGKIGSVVNKMPWLSMNIEAGPFNISDVSTHTSTSGNGSPHWDYADQSDWKTLYPQCNGASQSPINIERSYAVSETSPCIQWHNYNNLHPKMTISNNGHTVQVVGPWGNGNPLSQPTMEGGPLNGRYQLGNVHWHWGGGNTYNGAEHTINSQKSALEMHFVHFKTTYANVSAALASGNPEALAVVAVMFQPSIWTLPLEFSMLRTLNLARQGRIIFPAVFPLEIIKNRSYYYTYIGSLTTPPCTENIRWIVFERPLPITKSFIDIFKGFRVDGVIIEDNFREIQPINGRKISRQDSC